MTEQWLLIPGQHWYGVRKDHPGVKALFDKHCSQHSYTNKEKLKLLYSLGEEMILVTPDVSALFIWKKFVNDGDQQGVNCAVFRNESGTLSSLLILEAEELAWKKWPGERLYTYVNPKFIKSSNPGYCFLKAGWRKAGITRISRLIILEKYPLKKWVCQGDIEY